jgi:hypothetical protein
MATDAFGRLRTSEPFTTFNYYPTPAYNDTSDNDVWVRDSSGGEFEYDTINNLITLSTTVGSVSPNPDKFAYRGTKVPMDYQPGKSRLIMMSGVMMTPIPSLSTQIFSRMGLMNIASPTITDGVYFEVDGSNNTLNWCESVQDGSGGHIVNKIPDASWNIDKFNGSGPSGKTLNFSNMNKVILIVIDQEWLGVGRLRCGFNIDGVTYYAHAFTHGTLSQAYTASPRQRLGYEILTGTNGTSPATKYTIKQICSTCISEGGFFPIGTRNSVLSNPITLTTANQQTLILAIKIKSDEKYKNGIIKPMMLDMVNVSSSSSYAKYELRLLSSINGATIGTQITDASFVDISNSIVKYYAPSNPNIIITGGYTINSGFVTTRSNASFGSSDYETLLTRSICTQYDTLAIIATRVGNNNPEISASIDFIESL